MKLVIVESPTKARTISKYLGSDYEIKASMGHVMDLPKSTLGVDVEHDFAPQFELVGDKKNVISELQTAAKNASKIILATDPDREGEAIAAHVAQILRDKDTKISRIVFHEITKEAIEEALKNPRDVDQNLVNAQTARRVLDRLVGYKLSPLLWKKVRRGLSAGRVQSVALRLIVEREREIERFVKEKYFTVQAYLIRKTQDTQSVNSTRVSVSQPVWSNVRRQTTPIRAAKTKTKTIAEFSGNEQPTEFELIEINGEKIEERQSFDLYDGKYQVSKTSIKSAENAEKIVAELSKSQFTVENIEQKETRRSPLPPFTTSTLQQEASRRFGFSGKRTMSIAQKLYEEGFITYHRTDSVAISSGAVFSIRNFVEKEFGKNYVPEKPRFYKTKQKLAQEAHEGIRPTNANIQHLTINKQLGGDASKLYELIWKRAVASQMSDSIIESTTVLADSISENSEYSENQIVRNSDNQNIRGTGSPSFPSVPKYRLKASGSVLLFDGFLKVNPQALSDTVLPDFEKGENLSAQKIEESEHETPPPPRYNDASLIKTLEEKGIGRPSTYATIIGTIEERQYVEKEEGRFLPTNVGLAVNDFLVENFSTVDDIPFTAEMEDQLDSIANGGKPWVPIVRTFYTPFEKILEKVEDAKRVKIEVEETDEKCPECSSPLVIRIGRFGKFLACSAFPNCKFTKPFVNETEFICPKCGKDGARLAEDGESRRAKIVIKKTKKGRRFYGCSNYPKCDFAAWKLGDIKKFSPEK